MQKCVLILSLIGIIFSQGRDYGYGSGYYWIDDQEIDGPDFGGGGAG